MPAGGSRRDRRFAAALLIWFVANTAELASGAAEAFVLLVLLNATGALIMPLTSPSAGAAGAPQRYRLRRRAGPSSPLLWLTFADALRTARARLMSAGPPGSARLVHRALFDDLFYREYVGMSRIAPSGNVLFCSVVWAALSPAFFRDRAFSSCALASATAILTAFAFIPSRWIIAVPLLRNIYHVDNTFSAVALVTGIVVAGRFQAARKRGLAATTGAAGRRVGGHRSLLVALVRS